MRHKAKTKKFLRYNFDLPKAALYGRLGDLASRLAGHPTWLYPALLTAAAGRHALEMHTIENVRPQLYTLLMGPPNSGKSRAASTAVKALNPEHIGVEQRAAGSEIGLFKLFALLKGVEPPGDCESRLLLCDEFESLLNKARILGATLDAVLRNLFYEDIGGSASKTGNYYINSRISILGCLPVTTPAEFRALFGYNTRGGLYDRFVFAPSPWDIQGYDDLASDCRNVDLRPPTDIVFPLAQRKRFAAWADAAPNKAGQTGRRRLQEIGRRIAVISGAMNRDAEVTPECADAALAFCDWQETVRKYYKPSEATCLEGELREDIIETLLHLTESTHDRTNFVKLNRAKNWSRHGAGKIWRVWRDMIDAGEIRPRLKDQDKGNIPSNYTGEYHLEPEFYPPAGAARPEPRLFEPAEEIDLTPVDNDDNQIDPVVAEDDERNSDDYDETNDD